MSTTQSPAGASTPIGPTPAVAVRLVGGPTALIEIGGARLLTDPTFSDDGVYETAPGRSLTKTEGPGVAPHDIGALDAVLLSHDQHADNLDPAGREVLTAAPVTLTTPAAAERLGGNARALVPWDRVELSTPGGGRLLVTAVPARHGPPGCEPVTGEVTGFVITGDGVPTVYVSGDNASLDAVQAVNDRFDRIDVALVFAGAARTSLFDGAQLTLTSREAAAAAVLLQAPRVVPLHVRGWAHFSEGPDRVRAAFQQAGITDVLHLLEPGERVEF